MVNNEATDLTPYISNAKLDLIGITLEKKSPTILQLIKLAFLKKVHLPLIIQKRQPAF